MLAPPLKVSPAAPATSAVMVACVTSVARVIVGVVPAKVRLLAVMPVRTKLSAPKFNPPMVIAWPRVTVPAVPAKKAVSAEVKLAIALASVPAADVDQKALEVFQAPVPPVPALVPLASQ